MQTQTVFQGLDAPKYKSATNNRTNSNFYNSFNDTKFAKPSIEKHRPKFPQKPSFDFDAKSSSSQNTSIHHSGNTSQLPSSSNYSSKEIESLVAELEKLKSENSELISNKYSKNGEISVLREEIKRCEIKLNNEKTERQKLSEKKSQEIAEIKSKVTMQLESMKSERDFISRELDLSKEALRKKDKKMKEMLNNCDESPNKRLKIDSFGAYSPHLKRKMINKQVKVENGIIPHSIDRSLYDETDKSEPSKCSFNQTTECGVQTVNREKHLFILKNMEEDPSGSLDKFNSLIREYYGTSFCNKSGDSGSSDNKSPSTNSAFTFLVLKIRDLAKCDYAITEQNHLFLLLKMIINREELNSSQINQLFNEIKFVQRSFIKIVEETPGKGKNMRSQTSSLNATNIENLEETKELLTSSKAIYDNFLNFLTEVLNLLEEGCETTSTYICTRNKGKYCC